MTLRPRLGQLAPRDFRTPHGDDNEEEEKNERYCCVGALLLLIGEVTITNLRTQTGCLNKIFHGFTQTH